MDIDASWVLVSETTEDGATVFFDWEVVADSDIAAVVCDGVVVRVEDPLEVGVLKPAARGVLVCVGVTTHTSTNGAIEAAQG